MQKAHFIKANTEKEENVVVKNFLLLKLPAWYVLSNLLCKNMTPNALKCILLP
jgi:hypothetical protein